MFLLILHIILVYFIFSRTQWLRLDGISKGLVPFILLLKVIGGYFIARYYLATYKGGDMLGYLADANQFYILFTQNPVYFLKMLVGLDVPAESMREFYSHLTSWFTSGYSNQYNDARSVIRFHALIRLFSNGNDWIHLLWSNVFCLMGMIALIKFIAHQRIQSSTFYQFALLLLFIPNVFIWSSAIMKEPLLIFAMGMTLRYFQLWNDERNFINFFKFLIFVFCFLLVKSFWLLAFLPGILIWTLFPQMKKSVVMITLSYAVSLIIVLLVGEVVLSFNLPDLLFGQQRNMWRFVVYMNSGSLIHPLSFAPNPMSFLLHIPEAFCYGMFQPWPWQLAKWFYFPLSLENFIFPAMVALSIYKFKIIGNRISPEMVIALIAGMVIVIISAFTTPVIGSLIRYRMPGLLLMVLTALAFLYSRNVMPFPKIK
ncbi:MAG: hypothetical protein IPO63_09145 [Bacteroidetes bacterium]|nr:hypothetical protein [Bacteroidota bacterium]